MNYTSDSARDSIDPAVAANSIHAAKNAVLEYARDLRALNSSTEQDFLSLGLSLDKVSSVGQTISTLAASVVELVRNEEVERDASKFRDLFDAIGDHFSQSRIKTERGHDALRHMADTANEAYGPLSAFRKIVKHLRILSVSTRIENARLVNNDHSFDVLAKSVEELSVMIALKSESFLAGLTSLQKTIKETAGKIVTSGTFVKERTELMLDSLSANLSMLSEKASSSLRAASILAAKSDEIYNAISEVVSSLQFHDITRQQVEHVAEIFEEIGAGQSDDIDAHTAIDALEHVGRLQIDQLKHAKDELISAIERVITGLYRMTSLLTDISRNTTTLISAAGGGKSFLSELDDSLSLVMISFSANEETGKSLSASVRSVTGMVAELTVFVNDIEEIGSEIELIALNAQIKASHTEEDGGALGVLAEAIRALSDDASSQTLIMTDVLRGVRDIALELDALGKEEGSAGRNIYTIKEQMQGLFEELGRSHQTLVRYLDDLDTKSSGLSRTVETAVSGITAHDRTNKTMGSIIQGLERLFACGSKTVDRSKVDHYLKLVSSRYTMVQERRIHESYLDAGTHGRPEKAEGSDFGDNVELF